MIRRDHREIFSCVHRDVKARLVAIRKADPTMSEMRVIREAVIKFLPEVEQRVGLSNPTHEQPRRSKSAA